MRVFLIAGEVSGDSLGAALMAGLKDLVPDVSFDGVGGAQMQAEGLQSRFPMDELSVMGLAEILPKYRALKARISQTAQAVIDTGPDVLITIDSPDFCLRVARRVKAARDIRTVHYVAPTVWAWRAGRAEKMAQVIDHVLALFPFEPPFMTAAGMECDFVGHPVVAQPVATPQDAQAFRAAYGLGDAPVMLVLPGSRHGEVSRLSPVFARAVTPVLAARPDLRIVIPAAAPVAAAVRSRVADWPGAPIVLDPRQMSADVAATTKRAAFGAADLALAASGTVSLELAAAGTPMVIAYDMNWLSRQIITRMLRVDSVTLVNLVSDTRVVPEFIGADCLPERIGASLLQVLADPTAQQAAMRTTMERLGQGGEPPGLRAARAVLARM
ncbi:lipid-A-disaccharide synthase [Sulfitobacter sabulilitoris]|uniref:Lipid-A-disaccharide synthase n=1 Tax=Sulfitobacter sabulilitoris TaxID=2562655 RepID=A0A5S3PLN3_9RHOB|nr:lipid-A-disaccharide synthase [Sulfitobacter sabulilitoris]TMM54480.1 lipid-A-disaccharide synthase [Sulfitobacter sabulilitoris]